MNDNIPNNVVSVIIPTFNREKFIADAIKSVLNQDYKNLEILVIDDSSTDKTMDIAEDISEKFSNVRLYRNEFMKGPSGARNTGLSKAVGDYLAFLDSDDIWLDDHLKQGMSILEKYQDIDVLFANFQIRDHKSNEFISDFFSQKKILHILNHEVIEEGGIKIRDNLFKGLIQENFFHLGSSIIRKKVSQGIKFDENVKYAEDRDFAIRLYKEGNAKFAYRPEPVFISYEHSDKLTNYEDLNRHQNLLGAHILLFSKYLVDYELSSAEKSLLKKSLTRSILTLAYNYRVTNKFTLAYKNIFNSFKYRLSPRQFTEFVKLCFQIITFKIGLKFKEKK